jgi:hypothetical protein
MEARAASVPDLSLHISLPSSAASPSPAPGLGAGGVGRGAQPSGGDPWRRLNGSTASTELSLSPPPPRQEAAAGDVLPWRLRPPAANYSSSTAEATFLPVTVPRLSFDAAAEAAPARPINGVPVYSSPRTGAAHPFLGAGGEYRQCHHQKAAGGLYNPYHSSSSWPSSLRSTTTSPLGAVAPPASDPTASSYLSPSAYHRMLSSTGRLHLQGVLADTLRGYGGRHHHRQHLGSLAAARYMPRLPASRRGMRAPRMRWTSSLHARFVHAVELLGGHERESLIPPLCIHSILSSTTPPKKNHAVHRDLLGSFHAGCD